MVSYKNVNKLRRQTEHVENKSSFRLILHTHSDTSDRFFIDLYLGSPPRRVTGLLDTLSSLFAIQCSHKETTATESIVNNYHETAMDDEFYINTQSSSFHRLKCDECIIGTCHQSEDSCDISYEFYQTHGSHSSENYYGNENKELYIWRGYEAKDLINFSKNTMSKGHTSVPSFPVFFQCHDDDKDNMNVNFNQNTTINNNAIIGLNSDDESLWKQLFDSKYLYSNQFSLCFHSRLWTPTTSENESGFFLLGGDEVKFHSSPMVYTKTINRGDGSGFNEICIRHLYLRKGNISSRITPYDFMNQSSHTDTTDSSSQTTINAVLNSANPESRFTIEIDGSFREVWEDVTGFKYSNEPTSYTDYDLENLPSIVFQICNTVGPIMVQSSLDPEYDPNNPSDIFVTMPSHNYMQYDSTTSTYKSLFFIDDLSGTNTLGSTFFMGHDISFNMADHTIGFAESTCDYTLFQKGDQNDDFASLICSTTECKGNAVIGFIGVISLAVLSWMCLLRDDMRYSSKRLRR